MVFLRWPLDLENSTPKMGFWKLCMHLQEHQTVLYSTLLPERAVRCSLWQQCTQASNYISEQSHLASRIAQWVNLTTCLNFCKILPRKGKIHWNAQIHLPTFSGYMLQPPTAVGWDVHGVSWFFSQCIRKRIDLLSDVMITVTSAEYLLKERRM